MCTFVTLSMKIKNCLTDFGTPVYKYMIKWITYEVRNYLLFGHIYLYKDICTHCRLCILLVGLRIGCYHLLGRFHSQNWKCINIQFLYKNRILQMYKISCQIQRTTLSLPCVDSKKTCITISKGQSKGQTLQWSKETDKQWYTNTSQDTKDRAKRIP